MVGIAVDGTAVVWAATEAEEFDAGGGYARADVVTREWRSPGETITTFGNFNGLVDGFAVGRDGIYVYGIDLATKKRGIYALPRSGGTFTGIETGYSVSSFVGAVNEAYYWAAHPPAIGEPHRTIMRTPKLGGEDTVFIDDSEGIAGWILDETGIYWVTMQAKVKAMSHRDDREIALAEPATVEYLADNATHVLWLTEKGRTLQAVPKQGGPVLELSIGDGGEGVNLAADAENAYVSISGGIAACPLAKLTAVSSH